MLYYLQSHISKDYDRSYINVYRSKKKLNKSILRKEYYQYLDEFALESEDVEQEYKINIEDLVDLNYDSQTNTLIVNYKNLDFNMTNLHLDWNIQNLAVNINGKNIFIIKSNNKFNSRFIPAILFSYNDKYLEICDTFNNFNGNLKIATEFELVFK